MGVRMIASQFLLFTVSLVHLVSALPTSIEESAAQDNVLVKRDYEYRQIIHLNYNPYGSNCGPPAPYEMVITGIDEPDGLGADFINLNTQIRQETMRSPFDNARHADDQDNVVGPVNLSAQNNPTVMATIEAYEDERFPWSLVYELIRVMNAGETALTIRSAYTATFYQGFTPIGHVYVRNQQIPINTVAGFLVQNPGQVAGWQPGPLLIAYCPLK